MMMMMMMMSSMLTHDVLLVCVSVCDVFAFVVEFTVTIVWEGGSVSEKVRLRGHSRTDGAQFKNNPTSNIKVRATIFVLMEKMARFHTNGRIGVNE